jgi:hypothetical protein
VVDANQSKEEVLRDALRMVNDRAFRNIAYERECANLSTVFENFLGYSGTPARASFTST